MNTQNIHVDKNHMAYMDVLECKPPQHPHDEEYMKNYDFWRPLQKFDDDLFSTDYLD